MSVRVPKLWYLSACFSVVTSKRRRCSGEAEEGMTPSPLTIGKPLRSCVILDRDTGKVGLQWETKR